MNGWTTTNFQQRPHYGISKCGFDAFHIFFFIAAAALAESEKEINAQNVRYNNGESTYFEELNPLSDVPTDVLEAQKVNLIHA